MFTKLRPVFAEIVGYRLIAGLVFLLLLSFVFQPFQAIEVTFPWRLAFWIGVMGLALGVTCVARRLLRRLFAETEFSGRDLVLISLVFVLFVPSLWLMVWLLFSANGLPCPDMLSVTSYGALLSVGLILVRREASKPQSEYAEIPLPRMYKRLPGSFQGRVYRLTVQDHYVDVVTSEGTFTIRSRFTDAIEEMEPIPGHCTHRSHWVVDDAIAGVERKGGKIMLRLKNEELVPVSRKYRPFLEEDGLI